MPIFDGSLIEALCDYNWPGNIRELVNLVHRLSCFFPNQKVSLSQVPANLLPSDIARFGAASGQGFVDGGPVQNELDLSLYASEADNPVEDAIALAQGFGSAPVSGSASFPERGVHLKDHLAEIERNLIIQALEESKGTCRIRPSFESSARRLSRKLISTSSIDACRKPVILCLPHRVDLNCRP